MCSTSHAHTTANLPRCLIAGKRADEGFMPMTPPLRPNGLSSVHSLDPSPMQRGARLNGYDSSGGTGRRADPRSGGGKLTAQRALTISVSALWHTCSLNTTSD